MKRHNQILAGVLVIQIALSVFAFWPRSAVSGGGEPLFPNLEASAIVALTITDTDGNTIALKKTGPESEDKPASWALPEADDYPAQADKITPVLEKIVGLTTGRLVTRTDASHKRLQVAVDDFVRRVDLETADGTKYTLYLGSSPSYGATHFRLEGQSETYLTNDISTWDINVSAASWINTSYMSLNREKLTQVTLENANGTFVFTKDDTGEWVLAGLKAGEELASSEVNTIINKVTSVVMLRPLGKDEDAAYGMNDPLATATIETGDKTVMLFVGAQDPDDKSHVVKSSESPYYVRVAEYNVKPLVENTRDDFVQPPPTPTPEGDTTTNSQ